MQQSKQRATQGGILLPVSVPQRGASTREVFFGSGRGLGSVCEHGIHSWHDEIYSVCIELFTA